MSSLLTSLKNVSAKDAKMIADAETMLGPEPSTMGFAKNTFWGRFREDLMFPYPKESKREKAKCDALLEELEAYMRDEHPSVQIDQEERMPEWCIDRLFKMGVMGMTVPEQYGGLGLGVTSYNRALQVIGRYCGSTGVIVSAHQSIGCKAIMLFGSEEQKKRFLPNVAREYLSAFCLSEPQVGSDAAGQETRCEWNEEEQCYILNGEKKWSTSGALAGIFTVMAKQQVTDPKTGKTKEGVSALICTPDMPGVDIFQKNRSKTGIRGTWQARIRFTDVKVPKANLLHDEGRGLIVALTCLNYGRCTLSAGIAGAADRAFEQSTKWVQTRYQFDRPLADFENVRLRIARMSAYTYAMDSMLYMMTGMLDRGDADIMVETAMTKVFCSHYGWEVIDDAMQIMGGEGYVTENEFERLWRDNRIHRIVEGSNEVMQPFVFAYGGRKLAESMLGIQGALLWDNDESPLANAQRMITNGLNPTILAKAIPLGLQMFLGLKPAAPQITRLDPSLGGFARRLSRLVQLHSHLFKMVSKWEREDIVTRQAQQARVADNAILIFALSCALSKMDQQLRDGDHGVEFQRERAAFAHLFDLFELKIEHNGESMQDNADDSMREAAVAALGYVETLPNSEFVIHESSPIAKGTGMALDMEHVKQFPGGEQGQLTSGDGEATASLPTVS